MSVHAWEAVHECGFFCLFAFYLPPCSSAAECQIPSSIHCCCNSTWPSTLLAPPHLTPHQRPPSLLSVLCPPSLPPLSSYTTAEASHDLTDLCCLCCLCRGTPPSLPFPSPNLLQSKKSPEHLGSCFGGDRYKAVYRTGRSNQPYRYRDKSHDMYHSL